MTFGHVVVCPFSLNDCNHLISSLSLFCSLANLAFFPQGPTCTCSKMQEIRVLQKSKKNNDGKAWDSDLSELKNLICLLGNKIYRKGQKGWMKQDWLLIFDSLIYRVACKSWPKSTITIFFVATSAYVQTPWTKFWFWTGHNLFLDRSFIINIVFKPNYHGYCKTSYYYSANYDAWKCIRFNGHWINGHLLYTWKVNVKTLTGFTD